MLGWAGAAASRPTDWLAPVGEHSMGVVFRYTWWALGQVYYDLFSLGLKANLLWFLTFLPLIPVVVVPGSSALWEALGLVEPIWSGVQYAVFVLGGTVVLGALAGPGTAALFYLAQRFLDGDSVTARDFGTGFRRFFWRGWILLVVDLLILYALVVGFFFYVATGQPILQALGFFALYLVLMWIAAQAYLFPLAVRMDMAPHHALRNAGVLVLSGFRPSVGFLLVSLVVVAACVILVFPLVAVGPIALALTAHRVTEERLREYGVELPDPGT
jgi:uncharacterized membrane protein YesL